MFSDGTQIRWINYKTDLQQGERHAFATELPFTFRGTTVANIWWKKMAARYVFGPEWWTCDINGSLRKLQTRLCGPTESSVENISRIYDLIVSDEKPRSWIYAQSGSHNTQPVKPCIPLFLMSIGGTNLWILMCDHIDLITLDPENKYYKIQLNASWWSMITTKRYMMSLGRQELGLDLWAQWISRQNERARCMMASDPWSRSAGSDVRFIF